MPARARRIRTGLCLAVILLLEAACRLGLISPRVLVAPTVMAAALLHELARPAFYAETGQTLLVVLVSATLAMVLGFAAGVAIHAVPVARRALDPYLTGWYSIPFFAFYPVFIVMFGLGAGPLVVLAVLLGTPSMIVATLTALDRVPRVLRRSARAFRLSLRQELWTVRMPACLPHLMAGLTLTVSYAFIGVIAGEFILSTSGLGHEIALAYDGFATARMYGLILLTITVVVSGNAAMRAIERRLTAGLAGQAA